MTKNVKHRYVITKLTPPYLHWQHLEVLGFFFIVLSQFICFFSEGLSFVSSIFMFCDAKKASSSFPLAIIGPPRVDLFPNRATIEVSIKDPEFVISTLRNVYSYVTYNITYWEDGQKEKVGYFFSEWNSHQVLGIWCLHGQPWQKSDCKRVWSGL